MKMGVISFSSQGRALGDRLQLKLGDLHQVDHHPFDKSQGGAAKLVEELWKDYRCIVFISALGIASRLIAPLVKDKTSDPAIICLDDMGRFAIPVLSGHVGGANDLSREIAAAIGAVPVITTATDNRGIEAPDLFAKKYGYTVENPENLTAITALMVNGEKVGFHSDYGHIIEYEKVVELSGEDIDGCKLSGLIVVTNRTSLRLPEIPILIMRPSNVNLGIGCRKGVQGEEIISFVEDILKEEALSPLSVAMIGTVELKRDEPGILMTSRHFNCGIRSFTVQELQKVQHLFIRSDFVNGSIGVGAVSGPSAYLLGGRMIREKEIRNGITLSVSVEV